MYSLKEIKHKCARKNKSENDKLHWFSSKFAIYFSFIFIKLKLTADHVTGIFFITGFVGALFYSSNNLLFLIFGYIFFRLHIIFDMCDGDVARFNKSFSIRGAYWDAVIHSILNPLYYIMFSISLFKLFDDSFFLMIAPFIGLSSSLTMSVKNNYQKAKFINNIKEEKKEKDLKNSSSFFYKIFNIVSEIISIEGFIFIALFINYLSSIFVAKYFLICYLIFNVLVSFVKFILLSKNGYYLKRN